MKTLYFLALVGFALAVGWAIPFHEDKTEALDNVPARLKKIANDLQAEDTASYAGLEEDEDLAEDEDEDEQNEDENGENFDENALQEHGEDEDNDEADEADENGIALPNSVKKSSDPIVGLFVRTRRIVRGVRRVVRRFRRRRRRRRGRRRRGRGRRGRG